MRTRNTALALLLLLALTLPACQSLKDASPETHVANARAVYISAVRTMTTLAQSGVVDLAVAEQFEEVRVRAAVMLEAADAVVEGIGGGDFNFEDMTSTLVALQAVLTIAIAGAQAAPGGG